MEMSYESNGSNTPESSSQDNFVEFEEQGEEMGVIGQLGLGFGLDVNQRANFVNEEIPFLSHTPSQSADDQNSLESVVDSVSSSSTIPVEMNRTTDLLMAVTLNAEENKTKIRELASSAMDELVKKAFGGELLWQRQAESETETLNESEYIREFRAYDATLTEIMRMIQMEGSGAFVNLDENFDFSDESQPKFEFPQGAEPDDLRTEASRQIGFVNMNATAIIEKFIDLGQWNSVFSKIVSRAVVLGVLSTGTAGSYNESLQVMRTEFHVPTPLVPVRECQFARYCKQIDSHTWGIVDVSLESIFPNSPALTFPKRPSGCLIQEMPDGVSKIIWVEHAEVDSSRVHTTFRSLVQTGLTFGAKRWVETLTYHCERVTTLMSEHTPAIIQGLISLNGKGSLLRLGERMMGRFCVGLSASSDNLWIPFPENEFAQDYRVMCKRFTTTLAHTTNSISFATSVFLSASPDRVFDFLQRAEFRNQWDLLSRELVIEELIRVTIGENHANRISVLQAKSGPEQVEIMYLQESYRDSTTWYIVYAPMDAQSMSAVINGEDPDRMNILPSGFVIHAHQNGSILTLSFNILDALSTEAVIAIDSIGTAYSVLSQTTQLIRDAVLGNGQ